MTWNRHCSTHPKEPAMASEKINGQKRQDFCRPCWDHHRVTKLRHSPNFDPKTLIDRSTTKFNFTPIAEVRKAVDPDNVPRRAYSHAD